MIPNTDITVHSRSFSDLNLDQRLIAGIDSNNLKELLPLQEKCMNPLLQGSNTIVQGYVSSGKTTSSVITALSKIDTSLKELQALIILPTRENLKQACNAAQALGMHLGIIIYECNSLILIEDSIRRLQEGVHVFISTPRRVVNLLRRDISLFKFLRIFIIDEADETINRGFLEEICEIFTYIAETVQVCMFTNNVCDDVVTLGGRFLKSFVQISVQFDEKPSVIWITHQFIRVSDDERKLTVLYEIYGRYDIVQIAIFVRNSERAEMLLNKLNENGIIAAYLHEQMDVASKLRIIKDFRSGCIRSLVLCNMNNSSLHISEFSFVINYDMPMDCEIYLKRLVQTSRFPRKIVVINLLLQEDMENLEILEREYKITITELV